MVLGLHECAKHDEPEGYWCRCRVLECFANLREVAYVLDDVGWRGGAAVAWGIGLGIKPGIVRLGLLVVVSSRRTSGGIEGPRLALVLPLCSRSLEPLQRGRQQGALALYKHDRRGASLLNHRLERVWSGKAPSSRPPAGQQVFLWVGPGAVHS